MTVACVFENPDSLRNFSNSGRDGSSPSCNLDLTELIRVSGLEGRQQLNLPLTPVPAVRGLVSLDRAYKTW